MRLAVSVGCPSGVGPEVAVVAAALARPGTVLLIGDAGVIARAARARRIELPLVQVPSAEDGFGIRDAIPILQPTASLSGRAAGAGTPSRSGGAAQLAWIDAACDLVSGGQADALVTGPVSKEAISRSGAPGGAGFLGHTEYLAARLGAREVVMAFYAEALTCSLVTTHVPLSEVPRSIDAAGVARATYWLVRLIAATSASRKAVRVAVASLNPHAGEGGLLGNEEARAIVPGIARARLRLAKEGVLAVVEGPVPAETAFRKASGARERTYDGVVAMYHDQATIAMKCVSFGEAVNVSLGLPIVRTSVDHGTAYDIAGKGVADASGMTGALELAARLAQRGVSATSKGWRARPKS